MTILKHALFVSALTLSSLSAFATDTKFSQMDPTLRKELVTAMSDVIPVYIEATTGVLAEIDMLPIGTVAESTRLSEVPIPNLFERNAVALNRSTILGDQDFAGGRDEHDIAWLRKSLVGLKELDALILQSKSGFNVDTQIDQYVTVMGYQYVSATENHYQAIIEPVSRFYCNLDFVDERYSNKPSAPIYAEETCD